MNSCQGAPKRPAAAVARSTCSSPSPPRRVFIPTSKSLTAQASLCSASSLVQEVLDERGDQPGLLDARDVPSVLHELEPGARNKRGDPPAVLGRGRGILAGRTHPPGRVER